MAVGKKQIDIREDNKSAVIEHLLQGQMTLAELEKVLRLSHTALNKIVRELIALNVVQLAGVRTTEFGRPSKVYDVNPDCGVAAAIAVSARRLEIIFFDMKGYEINHCRCSTSFADASSLLRYARERILEIREHFRIKGRKISTLCVSVPAYNLFDESIAAWAAHIGETLGDLFPGTEILVQKDVDCICLAEKNYGLLHHYRDNALILHFEHKVSASIFSPQGNYSGIRVMSGTLSSLFDRDFVEVLCADTGLAWEEIRAGYVEGNPRIRQSLQQGLTAFFGNLQKVLVFLDIPLVIVCGEMTKLGAEFQAFLRDCAPGIEIACSSIPQSSSACAGAVWLATYTSLKKIILRDEPGNTDAIGRPGMHKG